jgi:hypothetical protein
LAFADELVDAAEELAGGSASGRHAVEGLARLCRCGGRGGMCCVGCAVVQRVRGVALEAGVSQVGWGDGGRVAVERSMGVRGRCCVLGMAYVCGCCSGAAC